MSPSDEQLASRAAEGDASAFDELVSRHRTRVYYLALSRVRSRETALDLTQDAFVAAFLSLASLREPRRFGAWLASITANVCKMYLRRTSEVPLPAEMIDTLRRPEQNLPKADAVDALSTLDELPSGTRSAAILYFIEEMKMSDIAAFLGISLPAVKARIRDARSRLQKGMIEVAKQMARRDEPGDEFEKSLRQRLELARWYREFSGAIQNGVSMMRALDKLRHADYSGAVRDATEKLMSAVESGKTMSQALHDLPALATPEALSFVTVAEMGGTLDSTLDTLADCMEARQVLRDIELSYWCRVLGAMLASGVGILSALNAAAEVARGPELRQATREIVEHIGSRESSMRPVLEEHPNLFPPLALAAIVAGERSGTLDYMLQWLAGELASDVRSRLSPTERMPGSRSDLAEAIADPAQRFLSEEKGALRTGAAELLDRFGVNAGGQWITGLLDHDAPELHRRALRSLTTLDRIR